MHKSLLKLMVSAVTVAVVLATSGLHAHKSTRDSFEDSVLATCAG